MVKKEKDEDEDEDKRIRGLALLRGKKEGGKERRRV